MQPMTVTEIVSAVKGVWWNPSDQVPAVSAVSTDSRKIIPGCLFLPWVGEKFDGHQFIDAALDAGAAGCLCAKLPQNIRPDKFYIKVADTRLALRDLASAYRDKFQIPFVQITGSVGKTTTKEMIAAVLEAKLNVLKTPENFNNDIGTPLTLLGLAPEHQAAVIETGMNHFGEIEAVLNGDDALLDTVTLPQRIVRCGQSEHCQVRIYDIVDHGVDGITCTVTTPKDTYALSIPAPGEHMAYSASMAVAVGEELGLSREEIIRGVAAYEPTGSRMHVIRMPEGRVLLDDCYNANPQSVTAALEVLGRTDCERRVAVLGDMGELGDLTDQAHFNAGALAAMLGIDFVIAIGEKAVRIADGAAMSGGDVVHFATKEEALQTVKEQLQPNTSMLIKASHAMRFEALVEALKKTYD